MRDDGVGIPEEMLESAFDLFMQSRRTLDRSDGGLGVRLTLVRGLVNKHGGSVNARSEGEGKGSEFVVTLPLSSAPPHSSPDSNPPPKKIAPGSRIVIIEDNADSRELLCELLTLTGFECHSADNGTEGLALIDEVKPRMAIIDIGLPGIDGLELARRIRARPEHRGIFLIALTGYGQRSDRDLTLKAGFDAHLVKPADIEALKQLLGQAHATPNGQVLEIGGT